MHFHRRLQLGFVVVLLCFASKSYSNSCSFIGSNTEKALDYASELYSNLQALKESTDCKVSGQSFDSLDKVKEYFGKSNNKRDIEYQIAKLKVELSKYTSAYIETGEEEWNEYIIETKKELYQYESDYELLDDYTRDSLLANSMIDMKDHLSVVIDDFKNYASCLDSSSGRVGSAISSVVKLSGSIATVAGTSPLWGGVGNLVGDLIKEISSAIREYRWSGIQDIRKMEIFFDLTCMMEMQSNFWCEKQSEVDLIYLLMDGPISDADREEIWEGLDIQSRVFPAIQTWIRTVYYGKVPVTVEDTDINIRLKKKIGDAEAILDIARANYNDLLEDVEETNDGSSILNLIKMKLDIIAYKMVGPSMRSGMGGDDSWTAGMEYFKEVFGKDKVKFILLSEKKSRWPVSAPTCSDGCDLTVKYLKEHYGALNAPLTDEQVVDVIFLRKVVGNIDKNISEMKLIMNEILYRDLRKANSTSPENTLHEGDVANDVLKLSAREALIILKEYTLKTLRTLRRFYKYGTIESEDGTRVDPSLDIVIERECLQFSDIEEKIIPKEGCPLSLQIAYKTKRIVNKLFDELTDNTRAAKDRVENIKTLLQFKKNSTLLLNSQIERILKADLYALIKMDEITPASHNATYLKKESITEILKREDRLDDFEGAIVDRLTAQHAIKTNLSVLIKTTPLRKMILSEVKKLSGMTFDRACTILLSSNYDKDEFKLFSSGKKNKAKKEVEKVCKGVKLESIWNSRRVEGEPEMSVEFNNFFNKPFKERVCAFRDYRRSVEIYQLKRKIRLGK